MNTSNPPFLPFTRPEIDEATLAGVNDVFRSGWLTTGQQNQAFEHVLSQLFAHRPVRTFSSGTATLEIALKIAQVKTGDEVITTPMSWVATSNVILSVGATPVFVDIDFKTRLINLKQVEQAITPRTKAIMPVDLAGLPVNRDQLYALAKKFQLRIIEDAAQALGANWQGKAIGASGDLVSFSFHPNKNLTSIEGGALVLNHEDEARLAEKYRLQGITRLGIDQMECDVLGGKFNLTDVAARVGLGQLPHLTRFTHIRRQLAQHYFQCLAPISAHFDIQLPPADFTQSNWHMFQILLPLHQLRISRAELMNQLKEKGIGTGVHYPAIHLFKLYRDLGFQKGMFPNAEMVGERTLTLPLFTQMTLTDVERVCDALTQICHQYQR